MIIRIVISALIPIILGLLLSHIERTNSKEIEKNLTKEHIVIRLPKVYMWVGCLDISVFAAFICIMTLSYKDITGDSYRKLIEHSLRKSDCFMLVYFGYGQAAKMKRKARGIHDRLKPLKIKTRYDPMWPHILMRRHRRICYKTVPSVPA